MKYVILPWEESKILIREGDVLLFRGTSWISKLISSQGETPYSHVGLASWVNGESGTLEGQLECVEFREFKGSRAVNLYNVLREYPNSIDVYRPIEYFSKWVFNPETHETHLIRSEFNGKKVTKIMRKLSGLPYSYRRIWWMIKKRLVFFRLLNKNYLADDTLKDVIYPVCSTAVSYAFSYHDYDLLNNRSDEAMEPSDIARSSRLSYLFTIGI